MAARGADRDPPGTRDEQPGNNVEEGGFARAAAPYDRDNFTGCDRDVQMIEDRGRSPLGIDEFVTQPGDGQSWRRISVFRMRLGSQRDALRSVSNDRQHAGNMPNAGYIGGCQDIPPGRAENRERKAKIYAYHDSVGKKKCKDGQKLCNCVCGQRIPKLDGQRLPDGAIELIGTI